MLIGKYIKDKNNKYKIIIDGEEISLYEDTILKYNLLFKKNIDKDLYDEIIKYNNELISYYEAFKYINKKMRFKKEIIDYLNKKGFDNKNIFNTISKLEQNNLLNDEITTKCYISDQINLSNKGYNKIKKELLNFNIDEEVINTYLDNIDDEIWNNKIINYIEKKININNSNSEYYLKSKITNELIRNGFNKEKIENILNQYHLDDKNIYLKEYEKAKKRLSKKYEGYELDLKIKQYLYRKGFGNYYE